MAFIWTRFGRSASKLGTDPPINLVQVVVVLLAQQQQRRRNVKPAQKEAREGDSRIHQEELRLQKPNVLLSFFIAGHSH